MKARIGVAVLAGLALGLSAASASATMITRTFVFKATDFIDYSGHQPAPISPVVGSFTVKFDPFGGDIVDSTANLHVNSLNLPNDSPFAFDFFQAADTITLGGLRCGVSGVCGGTDDFFIGFRNVTRHTLHLDVIGYSAFSLTGLRTSFWSTSTAIYAMSAAPEPAVWTTVILGFAMLGVAVRRRRRGLSA